jgi:hypothetical protein
MYYFDEEKKMELQYKTCSLNDSSDDFRAWR